MPTISKLQQRDLEALEILHPETDFETAYLEQLQDLRYVLVASRKDEDGKRRYLGYVSILWQSNYTLFWRHNIPEISEFYVAKNHRRQGIGTELIKAIEIAACKKNYSKIGIRLEQVGQVTIVQGFFQSLGYKERVEGSGFIAITKKL
jgi:GNAT superfamily N-acetyltransferase